MSTILEYIQNVPFLGPRTIKGKIFMNNIYDSNSKGLTEQNITINLKKKIYPSFGPAP